MTTMRRAYQGLHSVFRTNRNHKWGITWNLSTDLGLHLKTTNRHVLLEMPGLDSTTEFLTEIIRQTKTKQVSNQLFSKATLSQWLSRYVNNTGGHSEQTVSVKEFGPLKHRSIKQPDTVVRATDCVDHASSVGDNLPAVSLRDVLPLPIQRLQISPTWDFLDENILGPRRSGEAMAAIKKQLEIAAFGVPKVSKPVFSPEKFLRNTPAEKRDAFTDKNTFTVFIGSWNANGQLPPDTLDPWLLVDKEPPDIYAVGFQELDLSVHAFLNMDSQREGQWVDKVSKCINSKTAYIQVEYIRLVGMLLLVYIQEKHMERVSFIDADSVATGIVGVMGNKGGVSVRLTFYNTSLCFINSHLAAHQDKVQKRNSDYTEILSKTAFKMFKPPLTILDHKLVFWFGDLNYRIDLPINDAKALVTKRDYKRLLEADQLCKQFKKNAEAFKGFKEGIPDFDPTYKYAIGTDSFMTGKHEEIPSYCDRILWRGAGVQQLRLSSHPELKASDHKPVSSLLKIDVQCLEKSG